jgi:hypothetical protein
MKRNPSRSSQTISAGPPSFGTDDNAFHAHSLDDSYPKGFRLYGAAYNNVEVFVNLLHISLLAAPAIKQSSAAGALVFIAATAYSNHAAQASSRK